MTAQMQIDSAPCTPLSVRSSCTKSCCCHPFYCHRKELRKSAWNTPECLKPSDWDLAAGLALATSQGMAAFTGFLSLLRHQERYALFNRVLGYPEGFHYSRSSQWVEQTFFPGLVRYQLPLIRKALLNRPIAADASAPEASS